MVGRELAQRVSGGAANVRAHSFGDDGPHRRAVREKRRLRIPGGGQFIGRTFKADAAKIGAERGINFAENSTGHRERLGKIFSHAGFLRALTGEKKYDIHR
jgi:hypothetical protein